MSHAIRVNEWGGPEVLRYEEASRPVPKEDEVLICVHAAGVNPLDWKIRQGNLKSMYSLPLTPGCDVSGVIEEVGGKVSGFRTGDAVYSMIGRTGGYAEYAVAKADVVAPKPARLSHVQAAAVPLAALTAWQMLIENGELKSGQRVLIHAAAGGVGSFAVQFARHLDAYVIGTASAGNAEYLRELGARETIDYNSARFEDVARDIDLVIDLVGGKTQDRSWSVLKPGGTLVSAVGEPSSEKAQAARVHAKRQSVRSDGKQLREIGSFVDAGHLRVEVAETFPLAQAEQAHRHGQTGHTRGKLVLTVRG